MKTESLRQSPNPPGATRVTHLKVCSLICEDLREENNLIGRLPNMLLLSSTDDVTGIYVLSPQVAFEIDLANVNLVALVLNPASSFKRQ